MVQIRIPLYRRPSKELGLLDRQEPVTHQHLVALHDLVHKRLEAAVSAAKKLEADGWTMRLGRTCIECSHPDCTTEARARYRMRQLGIELGDDRIDMAGNGKP